MLQKVGEAHPNKPQHGRAGRGDERQRPLIMRDIFAGGLGDQLCSCTDFIHLIEADTLERQNDAPGVVQMLDLRKEHRCRQCDFVPEACQILHAVADCTLGVMGTNADTFAAINAALAQNARLTVPHADRLGGAALDTGDAAVTQLFI